MAIIISSKKVQDLPENQNVAIGITLPIQNSNMGYFNQSFNTVDAIKSNIKNLLSTRLGERVMQPNFGTRLWNILFENDNDINPIEEQIENTIEDAINYWLPFVSIKDIDVNKDSKTNRDKNIYNVSISFSLNGLQNLETVTLQITQ